MSPTFNDVQSKARVAERMKVHAVPNGTVSQGWAKNGNVILGGTKETKNNMKDR